MTDKIESSFSTGTLPSYKNPPVNEVVCGLRFDNPDKLRIPHIGFLWDKFRADYPIIQHAPPIASAKGEILVDQATGMPLPRVWFINRSDDQLIQFQCDRFYFNWRKRQNDYPRYDHVIKSFESVLNEIVIFFDELEFGELRPIEYELSYINHIPKGQGWNTIDDLPRIFLDHAWEKTKERFLPKPEKVSWQKEFLLPEKKGHLIVSCKQAIQKEDKVPLLVLELKTRGIDESATKDRMREWFDLAHEWIVRGFTDLTTPEIQKRIWEREENA
jgi:uncharacterized protein (TIGR04255 family)